MASTNGVIFPESMADFLANPVDICFGSMPANSISPVACLVIEGNTVTTNQQIETDLLKKTHPPTPSDLIAGIDRVEGASRMHSGGEPGAATLRVVIVKPCTASFRY
jgi:hypothetical protein